MSTRMSTWQKATALVPLALLSGAWTASLAVSSATASDVAEETEAAALPDGTSVPSDAVDQPANISAPGEVAPGVPKGAEASVVKSASTNGIPSAALAAYQRAAQVIDSADPSCKIEWPLVAAIGRVESNHGRYGGNTLSGEGVSTPGIYGIPLNGSNGTQRISDTDAGRYDDDKTFDRAVGPMQFIPSTWSVVGVDGDGDGERNPQDIDDAALASAVYLCSGDEDLSERAGQEAAVYRYNHSDDYVALVLSIMEAYASGDYSAVPNNSTAPTTFTPSFGDSVVTGGTRGFTPPKKPAARPGSTGGGSGGGTAGGSGSDGSGGTTPAPAAPAPQPDPYSAPDPAPAPAPAPNPGGAVNDAAKGATDKVKDTVKGATGGGGGGGGGSSAGGGGGLSEAAAKAQCLAQGVSPANLQSCINGLT